MEYQNYSPLYSVSHALIVGINNYQYASPLAYAINDANATAQLLIDEFGFNKENVLLLADADATRERIIKSFLSYVTNSEVDDRIVFFFAGHGHTVSGRRGEVGFLVPYDGDVQNLSKLIRWDELTRNAELISAKHIFFVMDACYGGLVACPPKIGPLEMRDSCRITTGGNSRENKKVFGGAGISNSTGG